MFQKEIYLDLNLFCVCGFSYKKIAKKEMKYFQNKKNPKSNHTTDKTKSKNCYRDKM